MLRRIFYISYDTGFVSIHSHEIIANMIRLGINVNLFLPDNVELNVELHKECTISRVPVVCEKSILNSLLWQFILTVILLFKMGKSGRPDMLYARQNYLGILPILLARAFGTPYFAEMNGLTKKNGSGATGIRVIFKAFMERQCLKTANKVIVPSNTLKQRLIKRYRIRPAKIEVVPNGANEELFQPREYERNLRNSLGLRKSDFVVGFVGSMGEWQGIEILKKSIRLSAAEPGNEMVKFLIVGDYVSDASLSKMNAGLGEGRSNMDKFIRTNGLEDKVFYRGYVSYEKSADFMNICDVLLAPYTTSYLEYGGGSPMKLYAYLACGKPVIISDLGEFTDSDMLKQAEAAILVPPDDSNALAGEIISLMKNVELRGRLEEKSREFVVQKRRWYDSCVRIIALYNRNLSSNLKT